MRHELLAVDAPCRRNAFSKRPQRKTGARLCGRTLRPNDDAVPPMEHIKDDRSDVLDADDVDRDRLQPLWPARVRGGENHCGTNQAIFVAEWLYLC